MEKAVTTVSPMKMKLMNLNKVYNVSKGNKADVMHIDGSDNSTAVSLSGVSTFPSMSKEQARTS